MITWQADKESMCHILILFNIRVYAVVSSTYVFDIATYLPAFFLSWKLSLLPLTPLYKQAVVVFGAGGR